MTSESGSSESGASRITERAVSWLLSRRSSMSIGEPERQTTRVPRRSGTLTLSSSSMSTLSRSARITMTGSLRLSLACVSSEMIVKIESDQPRITVWSSSSTIERPRRRSASLESMPLARTPIRALTMNRPPRVSASRVSRNRQLAVVAADGAGVEGVQQAVVQLPEEAPVVSSSRSWNSVMIEREEQRSAASVATDQPADQRRRARRHAVVEHVAEPVPEPRLLLGRRLDGRPPGSGAIAFAVRTLSCCPVRAMPSRAPSVAPMALPPGSHRTGPGA